MIEMLTYVKTSTNLIPAMRMLFEVSLKGCSVSYATFSQSFSFFSMIFTASTETTLHGLTNNFLSKSALVCSDEQQFWHAYTLSKMILLQDGPFYITTFSSSFLTTLCYIFYKAAYFCLFNLFLFLINYI